MEKIVLFWILLGVTGFAFALSVQMRVMTALVLRRALMAKFPKLDRDRANQAVIRAASSDYGETEEWLSQAAGHLTQEYPRPLNHLRKARRYSVLLPVFLLLIVIAGRFVLGVI